jgi:hypothetical protein
VFEPPASTYPYVPHVRDGTRLDAARPSTLGIRLAVSVELTYYGNWAADFALYLFPSNDNRSRALLE